jgi:hypothetical protein
MSIFALRNVETILSLTSRFSQSRILWANFLGMNFSGMAPYTREHIILRLQIEVRPDQGQC